MFLYVLSVISQQTMTTLRLVERCQGEIGQKAVPAQNYLYGICLRKNAVDQVSRKYINNHTSTNCAVLSHDWLPVVFALH